jgi:hypothetical protein
LQQTGTPLERHLVKAAPFNISSLQHAFATLAPFTGGGGGGGGGGGEGGSNSPFSSPPLSLRRWSAETKLSSWKFDNQFASSVSTYFEVG